MQGGGLELWNAVYSSLRGSTTIPDYWAELRAEVLADWIATTPGTRPWAFWKYDAPAPESIETDPELEPELVMRRRSGAGFPYSDPRENFGMSLLIDEDPTDPPVFESEASYLLRNEFLSAAEKKRLGKKDFEPETLELDDDEPLEKFLETAAKER